MTPAARKKSRPTTTCSVPSTLWSPLVSHVAGPAGTAGAGGSSAASGLVSVIAIRERAGGRRGLHTRASASHPDEPVDGHGAEQQGQVRDRPAEEAHGAHRGSR